MPVFYREQLSTGYSTIPMIGVGLKPLGEIRPQMFSLKNGGGSAEKEVEVKGTRKGTEHAGRLKGKEILLKNIMEKEITYTKRDRQEFKQLRNKFNSSVRKNFL
jgi:hypothetical protein